MRIDLLDNGYVSLVESWGGDHRIIEAARMSTQKGFQGWGPVHARGCRQHEPGTPKQVHFEACCDGEPGDEKLLRYLYENKHSTPFEFAGLVIEVQAPIFVFREWHRHRTQSYNEMSARYSPLPANDYVPTLARLLNGGGHLTKQAASAPNAQKLTAEAAEDFRMALRSEYARQEKLYQDALAAGVPKELARCVLPVGRYSRMRASANLRNWLAFLTLRMAPNAQWEIRQYANAVGGIIAEVFPRTWELFNAAP